MKSKLFILNKLCEVKFTTKTIMVLILVVSTILRFYNYFDIPFTHDEFSALFRLNFASFSELIEKGVKIDGHPAGVHVFLYYWTMLFGFKEWIISFPFTIFGIASVYLIFLIGKKWFNETVGLLSASYLASIQFTIMYSQIARPYISGLFFSLLMINYWSNLMINPNSNFNKNSILFVIASSLCSYNHHFSLLFAAIIGVTGCFVIQKKFLSRYLFLGIIIFILYIPHLKIFFYQLNVGGVESWLAKPKNSFIFEFIYFIFNYSYLVIFNIILLALFSLFYIKKNSTKLKNIIVSFIWFITPFLIGFFYSKYFNAVLQFSVLIFSFPFLFFVLFGFIKNQSSKINLILVLMILIINISSLIFGRQYYQLFYKSVYKQILIDFDHLQEKEKNTIYIIDSHKKITEYYIAKLNIDSTFINYSMNFNGILEFKKFLEKTKDDNDKLFLGCLSYFPPNVVPLIQDYYPTIQIQKNYIGGTTYLFSKNLKKSGKLIDNLNFDSEISKNWKLDKNNILPMYENSLNKSYKISKLNHSSPLFTIPIKSIIENNNNFIDISVKVFGNGDLDKVQLVVSLDSKEENVYWDKSTYNQFYIKNNQKNKYVKMHYSLKLSDIDLSKKDIILTTYIYNRDQKDFYIDDFEIRLRKGNPIIYGLSEKI